jgi:hypothetical protein
MPRLTRWSTRAALLYLLAGFSVGALILADKGLRLNPGIWRLLPLHIEFLLLGWTAQLALGVAYWILPRIEGGRPREAFAWAALGLLNLGTAAAGLGASLAPAGWAAPLGRALELAAAAAFAYHAWPRVRPVIMGRWRRQG